MATKWKEGDRVQIRDREATAEDVKSGLFYPHFRGLIGSIQKIYATDEVAVEIEAESLVEVVRQRHSDVQEQMKARWLDGLSEEARGRLSEPERDFRLRYTVLVSVNDLTAPGAKPAKAVPASTEKPAPIAPARKPAGAQAPQRQTAADYEAAEEAYLRSRQKDDR
jgi:hypothetical protein